METYLKDAYERITDKHEKRAFTHGLLEATTDLIKLAEKHKYTANFTGIMQAIDYLWERYDELIRLDDEREVK